MTGSNKFEVLADKLVMAIDRTFWCEAKHCHQVSTQPNETRNFYPGAVAQIYPWAFSINSKVQNTRENFISWYTNWNILTELENSDYVWGLIAIAAAKSNALEYAMQWQAWAANFRHGARWNILEEAVYQDLTKTR